MNSFPYKRKINTEYDSREYLYIIIRYVCLAFFKGRVVSGGTIMFELYYTMIVRCKLTSISVNDSSYQGLVGLCQNMWQAVRRGSCDIYMSDSMAFSEIL